MLRTLLRLPSPGFPADVRTGDPAIDAHLQALDATLVGSAGIRRPVLLEARDDLLEAKARATDAGTAVSEAITAFGPVEEIGRAQRQARTSDFWKAFWPCGLGFASLMLLFQLLGAGTAVHPSATMLAIVFVLQAVLFGVGMGYAYAYAIPKSMPSAADAGGPDTFVVRYPRLSIGMCWLLLLGLGTIEITLLLGMAGIGLFRTWSMIGLVLMALINVRTLLVTVNALRFLGQAGPSRVIIRRLGRPITIARSEIVSVTPTSVAFRLFWPGSGQVYRVLWRDASNRVRTYHLSINRELVHGDRLLAWFESAAGANRHAHTDTGLSGC